MTSLSHDRHAHDGKVLEISGLRFSYPGQSDGGLELQQLVLAAGERLFVQGPSGSGKSTLMSLLAGVLVASSGSIRLLGTDWAELDARSRDRRRGDHVGYIFQQFNLLPWLPVIDNVMLGCQFSDRRARRACDAEGSVDRAAARWLQALGLSADRHTQLAATLSVGEQQRVAAARALIGKPELLLADEPTSALDNDRRDEFMSLLVSACEAAGSALVFVSHDLSLARHFDVSLNLRRLA